MADGTQLKIADKANVTDEDPFAELTRIMGFDPRQPVVRQDLGAPSGRVEPAMDDDFGIDLEKELLGDLAGDDHVAAPVQAFAQAERGSYVPVDAPAYAAAPSVAPAHQPEFEIDASFDDAFAASFEQGLSLENELISADTRAYVEPVAYAPANDQAYVPVDATAYAQTHQPEFEVDASFDDAVAASFEQGMSLENELVAEAPAYAAEPQVTFEPSVDFGAADHYVPETAHADDAHYVVETASVADEDIHYAAPVRSEAELDAEFDAAMADVDMDFAASDEADIAARGEMTLGGYEPVEAELAFTHHDLSVEPDFDAPMAEVPAAEAHDYDEFERSLQSALSVEAPVAEEAHVYEAPVAAYEPEPVVAAPVAAAPEVDSLEDELNALLGTMSSQAKALSEPVVVPSRSAPAVEPVHSLWAAEQPADDAQDVYAEETAHHAPEAYEPAAYEPVAYEAQAHEVEDYADETAPHEVAAHVEPTYDHQADADVSFDDDAFDMALENSAEIAAPVVAAAAVATVAAAVPAPERPLAASRYEHARSWGLGTPVAPRATPAAAAAPVASAATVAAAASSYASVPSYETSTSYAPEPAPSYEPEASYVAEPAYSAEPVYAQHEPEPFVDEADAASDMHDDLEAELFAAVSSFDDAPEIETVDVPEKAVALADDLDIPELAFEDDTPPAQAFDDLDGEFTNLMNEMNAGESKQASSSYASNPYAAGFDRKELREGDAPSQRIDIPAAAAAVAAGAGAMYAGRAAAGQGDDRLSGFDLGMSAPAGNSRQDEDDEFAYDPAFDEAMASSGLAGTPQGRPARRGMMIAAIVAGVAVVGGIGAWALSFGGSEGTGAPVVVKADDSPIKVRPENPGGITVPNQDSKVYDRVAGGGNGAPVQEKLVTNAEEPIDVAAKEAEALAADNLPLDAEDTVDGPAPKSEERVAQTDQPDASTETAAVAPRKVRTMVVRPDGTLVPREEPAPAAVAAAEPSDPAPQRVAEPAAEATGTVPAKPALAPVAAKPAATATENTPASAPIAPQRPSEQPVNVVGEVKPDQVAAVAPAAPTAAASGAWAMQIASQPSEAAAKSTYDDLLRRYGSVLNGREVAIVKAEIAGKGTFWRVRVPAGTRNDAVSLCESYKAAGGNCFVSK